MPVYIKKTLVTSPRFRNRATTIISGDSEVTRMNSIPVPDNVVLCNGCNHNLCEAEVVEGEIPFGYLVYLGKRELNGDQPYDIYCPNCTKRYFPKAIEVTNDN